MRITWRTSRQSIKAQVRATPAGGGDGRPLLVGWAGSCGSWRRGGSWCQARIKALGSWCQVGLERSCTHLTLSRLRPDTAYDCGYALQRARRLRAGSSACGSHSAQSSPTHRPRVRHLLAVAAAAVSRAVAGLSGQLAGAAL